MEIEQKSFIGMFETAYSVESGLHLKQKKKVFRND